MQRALSASNSDPFSPVTGTKRASASRLILLTATLPGMKDLSRPAGGRTREQGGGAWGDDQRSAAKSDTVEESPDEHTT